MAGEVGFEKAGVMGKSHFLRLVLRNIIQLMEKCDDDDDDDVWKERTSSIHSHALLYQGVWES